MNIGQLTAYVQIQKRSQVKDAYGQLSSSWDNLCDAWANLRPITGREKMRSGAIESVISHTIAIHYNPQLLPLLHADAYRIMFADNGYTRLFNIHSAIDLDERHEYIIFDCEEGTITGD